MAREPYDLIVSLGDWCAPAANIRRRFGTTEAMPFDWWITPYNALIQLLEEKFENVLKRENLEILAQGGRPNDTVRCNHYHMLHHHDFTRDAEHRILPDIDGQLPSVIEKTRYIVERFYRSFEGKRVLLVRNGLYGDLWEPESGLPFQQPDAEQQAERATRLYNLLVDCLRPGHLDLVILSNLPVGTRLPFECGEVIFEQVGERRGDFAFFDLNFDDIFDRLGISMVDSQQSQHMA